MMKETGVVESVSNGYAVITIVRKSACGDSCKNCSGGCALTKNKITVQNDIGVKCGDRVYVETLSSKVLGAAFIVYILPLILFFVGYFVTDAVTKSNILPVVVGGVLFAVVFLILHVIDKKNKIEVKISKIK